MRHPDTDDPDLGACCACNKTGPAVRNVLMLHQTAPVSGTGWGCFVCGLPADGAVSVVCDDCLEAGTEPTQVIYGYPVNRERVGINDYEHQPFDHDMSQHPETHLT